MTTADAIQSVLQSPNVCDSNGKIANVVDVLNYLATGANRIATAITPRGTSPGHDEFGGTVISLTEAVMGITSGLKAIADAIHAHAEIVRENGELSNGH